MFFTVAHQMDKLKSSPTDGFRNVSIHAFPMYLFIFWLFYHFDWKICVPSLECGSLMGGSFVNHFLFFLYWYRKYQECPRCCSASTSILFILDQSRSNDPCITNVHLLVWPNGYCASILRRRLWVRVPSRVYVSWSSKGVCKSQTICWYCYTK